MIPVLEMRSLFKSYSCGENLVEVLKGVDLTLNSNETVAVLGPSGAGKSTLLQMAGLLDRCTSGVVMINGVDYSDAKESELVLVRRQYIGFIYQSHCLIPEMTAIENVMLPLMILRKNKVAARSSASEILNRLGIDGNKQLRRPAELSGGENQRVAVARAFVAQPKLLLADEPTGNLDPENADIVFDLVLELSRELNTAALIITHNETLAKKLDRALVIHSKRLGPLYK